MILSPTAADPRTTLGGRFRTIPEADTPRAAAQRRSTRCLQHYRWPTHGNISSLACPPADAPPIPAKPPSYQSLGYAEHSPITTPAVVPLSTRARLVGVQRANERQALVKRAFLVEAPAGHTDAHAALNDIGAGLYFHLWEQVCAREMEAAAGIML